MAFTYPLPQSQKANLDAWLDSLTEVTPTDTPNPQQMVCAFCEAPTFGTGPELLPNNVRDPGQSIIRLPCECQVHRGCAIEMEHREDNRDKCPFCEFEIFEKPNDLEESEHTDVSDPFEDFINTLRRPSISSVQEEGLNNECSICRVEYNTENPDDPTAEIEHAVQLSCNHIFGNHCLRRWLSAEDQEPTCPTCRRKVVIPLSQQNARELRVRLHRENTILRECIYWHRYWACHIDVHNLETANEMEDGAWLTAQIESTVANISEWIDETEEEMWERRASIRELLLNRVMVRSRRRLDQAAVQLRQVETMEAEGAWEEAAHEARWFGLPGFWESVDFVFRQA